ncbi:MAG: right-handed parallel beta-helix repeat-containing protein, partial [Phycisphaerales bacterium]
TIHIAPGVYTEQTRIFSKELTLIGQPGTILRALPGMAPATEVINRMCVLFTLNSDVVLRGLTFEGEQLGDEQEDVFLGAYLLDSGGAVEDCRFTGFREKAAGQNGCAAIWVLNDLPDAPLLQMRIARNTIVDSYQGVFLQGSPNNRSLIITVADNTISGVGPNATSAGLDGIAIGEGVMGEVVRNTISGFSYAGTGESRVAPFAFGIIAIGRGFPGTVASLEPLRIADNVLRNNQFHCNLLRADAGVVVNNTFDGTAPGVRPTGLAFSGENVLVTDNRFSNMEKGIELFGDDPDYGTVVGTASNATLVDNGFCNVDTNYNFQPLATYDLQSTLTCPEPSLDTVQAILLSWPLAYAGYSVESADSPDGPWAALDATVFQRDGMNYVAVPSDGASEFFRLVKP